MKFDKMYQGKPVTFNIYCKLSFCYLPSSFEGITVKYAHNVAPTQL